jgi:hypothetical protein
MAAQSSAPAKSHSSSLTVNANTMTKAQEDAGEDNVIKNAGKAEILAKALRIPLGADFKAFFTLEPAPRGIEAVREELESKAAYRAVFGVNIPL